MELQLTPVDLISAIWEESNEKGFHPDLLDSLNQNLEPLAEYLQISKSQAFVVAIIFVFNCQNEVAGILEIAKHLNCNPVKLWSLKKDTAYLLEAGYLKKTQASVLLKERFLINDDLIKAITENTSLPILKKEDPFNIVSLFQKIDQLYNQRRENEICTQLLNLYVLHLLTRFSSLPFVQALEKADIDYPSRIFFLYLCWKTLEGSRHLDLTKIAGVIFDDAHERITFVQGLLKKESKLYKTGWIELEEARFFNDTDVNLTESGAALLELENIQLFFKNSGKNKLIKPTQIKSKKLYYNQEVQSQIRQIENLLDHNHLLVFQDRLRNKNLPTGVSVLFYGPAGTGKTETVFQLAEKTKREIFKVEISETKSMWFGESEKLIKKVFDDYRDFLRSSSSIPILLFNEADAIISARKELGHSRVDQTENTIQNIILEELEKFDGIFMATTNLVNNFDKAFERRFLFKVELSKPHVKTRMEIWKEKLPFLNDAIAETLSRQFEFSGGQIDNIARKADLVELLEERLPDMTELINFCSEETLHKKGVGAIGFKI